MIFPIPRHCFWGTCTSFVVSSRRNTGVVCVSVCAWGREVFKKLWSRKIKWVLFLDYTSSPTTYFIMSSIYTKTLYADARLTIKFSVAWYSRKRKSASFVSGQTHIPSVDTLRDLTTSVNILTNATKHLRSLDRSCCGSLSPVSLLTCWLVEMLIPSIFTLPT
jgi:hypothetical protein